MARAKREVSSPEEVYSHGLLRYLSFKYAGAYIDPDDLLQEAALKVWEKQEEGETDPDALFLYAKKAMQSGACRGSSVDRAWPTKGRQQPIQVQQFDDMRSQNNESPGPDPMESWVGKDKKADQFPAVVALRDLIERIYAHDGYNDNQRRILQMCAAGLTSEEIQDRLGLSPNQYARYMRRLRTRIMLDALDGRRLPAPDDLPLTQQQKQIHAMYWDEGMTQKEIAARLGISRNTVCASLSRVQYKSVMNSFGLKVGIVSEGVNRDWLN